MITNRRPVYHKDKDTLRVISMPNGLWQAQQHRGGDGTKTYDPWGPLQHPCPYDEAIEKMNSTAKGMT